MSIEPPEVVTARIRDDVAVLSERLVGLAADLQRLSDALAAQPWSAPSAPEYARYPPPAYPPAAAPRPPAPYPSAAPYPPQVAAPRPARAPRRRATLPEIFSVVGSAITLIGVALVLMLPLEDNAVLGQVPRTVIALGLAASAITAAILQHRADRDNVGAQALLATGVSSTFLSVLALTVVFRNDVGGPLLPVLPGLALAGLAGVGGMLVARSWRSQWLAVLAILGSLLLAPWIGTDSLWIIAFMIVMTVGSGAVQPGLGWVWLIVARVLPTVVYFAVASADPRYGSQLPLPTSTAIAVLLAAVLALSGPALAVMHQSGTPRERVVGAVAMVPLAAPLMIVVWQADRVPATVACLVVGGVLTVAAAMHQWVSPAVRAAAISLGAVFLGFGVLIAGERRYQGYLYWGLAVAYLGVAVRSRFRPVAYVGSALAVIGLVHWLPQLGLLFDLSRVERSAPGVESVAESVLGVAVAVLAFLTYRAIAPGRRTLLRCSAWAGAVLTGSVAVVLTGALVGRAAGDPAGGFQIGHVVVTVTLAALCIVLLSWGLRGDQDAQVSVRLAIALAGVAVAKLFLFDLGTLPGLTRALAFLAVGVLLLVVGTWYHRQLGRTRPPAGDPPPGDPPSEE